MLRNAKNFMHVTVVAVAYQGWLAPFFTTAPNIVLKMSDVCCYFYYVGSHYNIAGK